MAAGCLEALDAQLRQAGFPDGAAGLPVEFLLELGAIGQLQLWDQQGLRDLLPVELPTAAEAIAELHRRATFDPQQAFKGVDATLTRQIMQVGIERFHWLEPGLIEADILIGQVDEDQAIEALAQLLWQHRHANEQDKQPNE